MPCHWLIKGTKEYCAHSTSKQYCGKHAFAIRQGTTPPQPCQSCGNRTNSQTQLCPLCGQARRYTILWKERNVIQIK